MRLAISTTETLTDLKTDLVVANNNNNNWTREGMEKLKQRSLEYIRSQPDDNTYFTDGSSDGSRVAAAVVHKEEEITIILNDSASVLDAEITAIRVALENASETRDTITIHTDSLTVVNILNNRKMN